MSPPTHGRARDAEGVAAGGLDAVGKLLPSAQRHREHRVAGDPTNWWLPNGAAVEAMLRSAGLRVVERPGHEIWVCEPERTYTHDAEAAGAATGLSR